jgi:hypothetical protein
MRHLLLLLLVPALAVACAGCASDDAGPRASEPPPTIDYAAPDAWLARPDSPSVAGLTPKDGGFTDLQGSARADVFYVHPTTGMREDVENVPIDDPAALKMGEVIVTAQATPFNAVARIFAPRYRQMALYLYERGQDRLQEPMSRAYADVKSAFDYYVTHYNAGRPFFLVAHSQGSEHALRLLSEAIQGTPLEQRMVAAYLPGDPIPRSIFTDDLTRIPPCDVPDQTGCVAIWGTFAEGHTDFAEWEAENVHWDTRLRRWHAAAGEPIVNVNPVTWTTATTPAPAEQHRGAVPFGVPATHFTRPLAHLVSARSDGRYTFVSPALPATLFDDGGIFGGTNYHVFDINLFWVDLRDNARVRLNAFLIGRDHASYPLFAAPSSAAARVGSAFRFEVAVLNGHSTLTARGLPPGLHLDADAGVIAGTPEGAGVFPVVLTATNASGSEDAELALTVEESGG